jgi:hypothetical protein
MRTLIFLIPIIFFSCSKEITAQLPDNSFQDYEEEYTPTLQIPDEIMDSLMTAELINQNEKPEQINPDTAIIPEYILTPKDSAFVYLIALLNARIDLLERALEAHIQECNIPAIKPKKIKNYRL